MIIDIARKQDWVPRSIRKSAKEIEEAQNILSHQLGRTPTDEEVANHLQISIKKYKEDLGKDRNIQFTFFGYAYGRRRCWAKNLVEY